MGDYVLIVEDDRDLAETTSLVLEAQGYRTAIAHDGRAALAVCAREMPALIVLDMMMPIMNGWEFAKEFDARYHRAAPILVVTAAENASARAKEIDVPDVLPKPYSARDLISCVRALAAPQAHP